MPSHCRSHSRALLFISKSYTFPEIRGFAEIRSHDAKNFHFTGYGAASLTL
jgi:hypothetical protein